MRKIDYIVIHCSATKEGENFSAKDIDRWHRKRGYRSIGYHYVIRLDGTLESGRPEEQVGAHVKGYNARSIGVCYIGGLSRTAEPKDTRTDAQKSMLRWLVEKLKQKYPKAQVVGHRDLSPDRNGNGKVDKWEWLKACPSFDVKTEL